MAPNKHGDLQWKVGKIRRHQAIPGTDVYRHLIVKMNFNGSYEVHPYQSVEDAAADLVQKDNLSVLNAGQFLGYVIQSLSFDVPSRINFVGYDAKLQPLNLAEKYDFLKTMYAEAKGRVKMPRPQPLSFAH